MSLQSLPNKHSLIESLLFVSPDSITLSKLSQTSGINREEIKTIINDLKEEYKTGNRGFVLREVAGGFKMFTNHAHYEPVIKLLSSIEKRKLTQAAMETLAVIAYNQPATKSYVSEIRGVNVDGVINTLLDKGLIKELGRDDTPGAPMLYATTKKFLESVGINSVSDLPKIEEFEPDEITKKNIISTLMVKSDN